MKPRQVMPRQRLLVSALLLALGQPAYAQVAEEPQADPAATTSDSAAPQTATATDDPTELDAVVVTGIRGSLTSSMNLKPHSAQRNVAYQFCPSAAPSRGIALPSR